MSIGHNYNYGVMHPCTPRALVNNPVLGA